MAWVKVSDTFNAYTAWSRATELAMKRGDESLVLQLKGATIALYAQSAVNFSDYVITWGDLVGASSISMAKSLAEDLETIGMIEPIVDDNGEEAFKLIGHTERFIHLIREKQRLHDRVRRRDRNNATLAVPVLLRDGSQCRYCGERVVWGAKTQEGGTFDHRNIEEETTVETLVVCCRGCNRARADFENPDEYLPLIDAPETPIYDDALVSRLRRWPSVVEREVLDLGIPNPLNAGEVEPVRRKHVPEVEPRSKRKRPGPSDRTSDQVLSDGTSQPVEDNRQGKGARLGLAGSHGMCGDSESSRRRRRRR